YGQLPPETRDYVPYVLAAAWLFLHPEDYGLEFPQVQGAATMIRLEKPASLYQLAICVGGAGNGYFRALRNLNPRYEPHQALAAGTELRVPVAVPPAYRAHCLDGERAEMAARLVAARKPAQIAGTASHRVRAGDTLSSISRRYRCQGAMALARANGLPKPYLTRPGQLLQARLQLVGADRADVRDRAAAEGCEAGAEDHAGVQQVGIGDDAVVQAAHRLVEQRQDEPVLEVLRRLVVPGHLGLDRLAV